MDNLVENEVKEEREEKSLIEPIEKPSEPKSVHFDGDKNQLARSENGDKKQLARTDNGDKKRFARTDRLSQPKQATQTYIYLLRDFAKFFEDSRRITIEQKISEGSSKQNGQRLIENERKKAIRIGRKEKAARKQLNKDQHDEIIQKIIRNIAISIRDPPRPMILGPNSRKLFNHIQSEIAVIVQPSTDIAKETVTKLTFAIVEFIRNATIETLEPAKVENTTMNTLETEVPVNGEITNEDISLNKENVEILKKEPTESEIE